MKATLTFTLPEEQEKFETALKGTAAMSALRIEWPNIPDQFFEYLRSDIYDSQNVTSEI
jgi:hypothetical protein